MPRGVIYHWKHGWIPLTHTAALSKAKGNHNLANRYLPGGSHASVDIRRMSDDHLAEHLATVADDEHAIDAILHELDRRDRVSASREKRKAARDKARDDDFERLLADGEDPETAYAKAFGVSEERVRRQGAIASLRANGYSGRNFDELVRNAFQDHAAQSWLDAESVTNGYLLNKAGEIAKVNPRLLFAGPESRARKYASEELLRYWQAHGRLTVDDFKAGLLGGAMRSTSTAAFA